MKVGTKSLLFGVHQIFWHPLVVARAWRFLYGRWPGFYESIAIFFHDWGYWGCADIDGPEGKQHPHAGTQIAGRWVFRLEWLRLFFKGLGTPRTLDEWRKFFSLVAVMANQTAFFTRTLVRYHSRYWAKSDYVAPSKLCWADKYCIAFDPQWFYLLRARLSGEVKEFRRNAVESNHVPAEATDQDWFRWYAHRATFMAVQHSLVNEKVSCPTNPGAPRCRKCRCRV